MNKAQHVSVALLGLVVVAITAHADPSDTSSDNNPYTQYDADGVPLSVTQPQLKQRSQEDIAELHKEQEQAARDKNWLLLDYEQQLKARAGSASQNQSANLYYQLSSNKDLAKLAGQPALDIDSQDSSPNYHTGATSSNQGSTALRPATTPVTMGGPLAHSNRFKPLITPLSEPDAAGLHDFYSSLPTTAVTPFYGTLPPRSAAPAPTRSDDSSDIETPGMIADKNNPLADPDTTDLTLDMLPGESIEHAKAHQDNPLELPLPMDADQLHKQQTASLSAPVVLNATQTPTTSTTLTPDKSAPDEDPNAPLPVSKVPQINPVRAPIANPFDILNR